MVYPNLESPQAKTRVWVPKDSGLDVSPIKVTSGSITENKKYWVLVHIPWSMLSKSGKPIRLFGFDVALDGPFVNKPGRRTQMVLFGDDMNCVDTSRFGKARLRQK